MDLLKIGLLKRSPIQTVDKLDKIEFVYGLVCFKIEVESSALNSLQISVDDSRGEGADRISRYKPCTLSRILLQKQFRS